MKNPYYNRQTWEVFVNSTSVRKTYSKNKAIDIAQEMSGQLFEPRKVEVVDMYTGEVIYQLN